MKLQFPTSKTQLSSPGGAALRGGCWKPSVTKWIVLCGVFASWRGFSQTTGKLPPLAPPHGEMPPTFWEQHGTIILIGIFIFILLVGAMIWKLLQPKPVIVPAPEVLAREALKKLADQPEDGRLLSQASQILRHYVVAVLELSQTEMTTTEFCRTLRANEKVGAELAEAIAMFSHECDERKFSPSTPSTAMNAVSRASELISRVETRRAQLQAPTSAPA